MTKHGECKTKLNKVWRNIKDRCYNPNNKRYTHYGARGITICPQWKDDYCAFRDWANANGYKEGLSIDRINNDGNYEPGNCRWATSEQQNNNFSRNNVVNYMGISLSVCRWAKLCGVHHNTLDYRIKHGWEISKALNYPDIIQCGDAFQVRRDDWRTDA